MRYSIRTFFFSWILIAGIACTRNPGYHVSEYKNVKFEDVPDDIRIPSKAWELLELRSPEMKNITASNVVFSEVSVFLVEKNPGIVNGQAVKILLPKGGGTVDLSRFISDKKGSFYVGFDFPEFAEAKAKKVLFVSGTRKRKIGGQIYGAGCNQFFDITERFFKEMKGEGLKVNTTQERYISVLGGTFLFSAQKDKDVHVAQVTFVQSEFLPLFCGEQ